MNPEMQYILSSSINTMIIVAINWICQVYIYTHILKTRNSIILFCIHIILRILIVNVFVQIILGYFYKDASWWGEFNFIMYWIYIFIYLSISYWTFDEEILRLFLVLLLGELPVAFFNTLISTVISILMDRDFSWVYFNGFNWTQIIVFIIGALIYLKVMQMVIPYFVRFINHLLVHRKIMWIIVIIYLNLGVFSWVYTFDYIIIALLISLCFCVFLIAILYVVQSYITNSRRRNDFLREQKELMEIHCTTVIRQIAKMKKGQEIMDEQMKEINGRTDGNLEKERVVSYINQLKDLYHEIKAGIYCNDWFLDAALYRRAQDFEKKKISLSVSMQGYDRGEVEEKDLVQMIMVILDYGEEKLEEKKKKGGCVLNEKPVITLKLCRVKNQLLINCSYPFSNSKKDKKLKKRLRYYLKKYNGICNEILQNGQHTVVISLSASESDQMEEAI